MADQRPPFDLLRAAFWLIALLVGVIVVCILIAVTGCAVGILIGRLEPGTCQCLGIAEFYRDIWSEALTAILALLVARQPPPPPPRPPSANDGEDTDGNP